MPTPAPRNIIVLLSASLFAGCGHRSMPPPPPPPNTSTTTATAPTQNVLPAPATRYMYDAYGPMQWSPFTGVSRENIYHPATGPTTGPVDDSVLMPTDDST